MSFTQRAFIRKNTPELRAKLCGLGIKVFPDIFNFPCLSCSDGLAFPADGNNRNGGIDCGDNENLFLAIAALRDDSDYMQWFKDDNNFIQSMINVYIGNPSYHKATVPELIEHFKTER